MDSASDPCQPCCHVTANFTHLAVRGKQSSSPDFTLKVFFFSIVKDARGP